MSRPFALLWTLAVMAAVASFVLHLALRGRTVDLGYELGRTRAEQARLREVKRVLSLEAASYETPQRVEIVARSVLGMTPPPPDRVVPMRALALPGDLTQAGQSTTEHQETQAPAGSASAGAAAAPPGGAP